MAQVTKKVRIAPFENGKGFFVSLQVISKIEAVLSTSLSAPITKGEYNVIQRLMEYSIPYFLGFDAVLASSGGMAVSPAIPNGQNGFRGQVICLSVFAIFLLRHNSSCTLNYSNSSNNSRHNLFLEIVIW